jgi:hypothetical protein
MAKKCALVKNMIEIESNKNASFLESDNPAGNQFFSQACNFPLSVLFRTNFPCFRSLFRLVGGFAGTTGFN